MAAKNQPDAESADFQYMKPKWARVTDFLDGEDAVRAARTTYLPELPEEPSDEYEFRLSVAKFTNVYRDVVESLAAKPFADKLTLEGNPGPRYVALADDIDGRGNNLHVFASELFFGGINYAVDWIYVEYMKARPRPDGQPLSIQDERDQGLRPYWTRIRADRMLDVERGRHRGQEVFVYARFRETVAVRDGFDVAYVERVRVLIRDPIYGPDGRVTGYAPARYELWEKNPTAKNPSSAWSIVDSGAISIGVIALVPFAPGRQKENTWRFDLPMQGAISLQAHLYQEETNLAHAKLLVGSPMLSANGVAPPSAGRGLVIGPRAVLYAPPHGDNGQHGEWKYIEIDAQGLKFLADEVAATERKIRELGRQPLTPTVGITVVMARMASQKASSTVQEWAWRLKDALDQALSFTAMYLGQNPSTAPTAKVHTDFALEDADGSDLDALLKMREAGDLSQEGLWAELSRRGVFGPEFDPAKERARLEEELPDPDDEADLAGALTPPAKAA
jgi:hypothetical protein